MDEKTGVQECWNDLAPGVGWNVGDIWNREAGSLPHHPSSLFISSSPIGDDKLTFGPLGPIHVGRTFLLFPPDPS